MKTRWKLANVSIVDATIFVRAKNEMEKKLDESQKFSSSISLQYSKFHDNRLVTENCNLRNRDESWDRDSQKWSWDESLDSITALHHIKLCRYDGLSASRIEHGVRIGSWFHEVQHEGLYQLKVLQKNYSWFCDQFDTQFIYFVRLAASGVRGTYAVRAGRNRCGAQCKT